MKILKIVLNIFLIILLIFSMSGFTLCTLYKEYVNSNKIIEIADKSNYYEELHTIIKNKFEEYVKPSGLSQYIFDNLVTVDQVRNNSNKILENLLNKKEDENKENDNNNEDSDKVDTGFIEQNLFDNISKDSDLKNIIEKNKDQIVQLAKYLEKDYSHYILNLNFTTPHDIILSTNKKITIISIALLIIILISFISLIILNLKNINMAISNIGISILSSGLIFIALKMYLIKNINIEDISFYTKAFSKLIIEFINEVLAQVNEIGIIYIIIGLITILISSIMFSIKINKKAENVKNG